MCEYEDRITCDTNHSREGLTIEIDTKGGTKSYLVSVHQAFPLRIGDVLGEITQELLTDIGQALHALLLDSFLDARPVRLWQKGLTRT